MEEARKASYVSSDSDGLVDHALRETVSSIENSSLRYGSSKLRKPWQDEDGEVIWSTSRIAVAKVVLSQYFDSCMGIVILANMATMIFETNADAECYPEYEERMQECPFGLKQMPWLEVLNTIFLIVYTVEAGARIFVERLEYPFNVWNLLDAFLVVLGWVAIAVQSFISVSFLRFLRIARLTRAARVLMSIRELYLLMSGFVTSLRAIFFGSICLLVVISLWGVILVQVVHPINASISYDGCERCSRGFKNVQSAILTIFQQVVAGDSWGLISIPVIEKAPLTAVLLVVTLITISLGLMNLILAVIVERATEARENDIETKLQEKDAQRRKNMLDLAKLCHDIDYDSSGKLSLDNFLEGMRSSKQFTRLLRIFDLERADIECLFHVLDSDLSGDVSYFEFCQSIDHAAKRDPQMMSSMVRYAVAEVKMLIEREVITTLKHHTRLLEKQNEFLCSLGFKAGDASPSQELDKPGIKSTNLDAAEVQSQAATNESTIKVARNFDDQLETLLSCLDEASLTSKAEKAMTQLQQMLIESLDANHDYRDVDTGVHTGVELGSPKHKGPSGSSHDLRRSLARKLHLEISLLTSKTSILTRLRNYVDQENAASIDGFGLMQAEILRANGLREGDDGFSVRV